MKLTLKLGMQTYQILINDDEVCIPSLSSILLAVLFKYFLTHFWKNSITERTLIYTV